MTTESSVTGEHGSVTTIHAGSGDIVVGDGPFLFSAQFIRSGSDLIISGADGKTVIVIGYFSSSAPANLVSDGGAILTGELVGILAGPLAPGQYAQAAATDATPLPIGAVVTVTGSAAVTRADGTIVNLSVGDQVFNGDVVQTSASSTLGLTFLDGTVFNMEESGRMVLNNLVYQEGGANNQMLFSLVQGGFSFFAGQIAPTGDMQVTTPVATLGIRGTSPYVFSLDGVNFLFSILRDPDTGLYGDYDMINPITGQPFLNVSDGATSFTLSAPGATPLQQLKTPQQQALDQSREQQLTDTFNRSGPVLEQLRQTLPAPGDNQDDGDDTGDQGDSGQGDDSTRTAASGTESGTPGDGDTGTGDPLDPNASGEPSQLGDGTTPKFSSGGNSFEGSGTLQTGSIEQNQPLGDSNLSTQSVSGGTTTTSGSVSGGTSGQLLGSTSTSSGSGTPLPASQPSTQPPTPTAATISLPDIDALNLVFVEDQPIVLTGFNIQNPTNTLLTVSITASSSVRLNQLDNLEILSSIPKDDGFEFVQIRGFAGDINNALNGLTYTPTPDNVGLGGIMITVDNGQASASATLSFQIIGENDPPVARDVVAQTSEDTSLGSINVLANDSDVDGDTLSVSSATAANGTVLINPDNTLAYTPPANFTGTDIITYVISDGNGGTATATVTVNVGGVSDPPVANNDTAVTNEDTSLNNIAVLANDTDADGDTLSISAAAASNGTVTINPSGTLNYTPNLNFNGIDTITYTVRDPGGLTDTATVAVTVRPVNDRPVAVNDIAPDIDEDTSLDNFDPLANDFDPDGTRPSIQMATALFGIVTFNADGTINYIPNANFAGNDTISYTVFDDQSATDTATVAVTVNPVPDAPEVAAGIANQSVVAKSPLNFAIPAGAFSDADAGDTLAYTATLQDGSALPAWLTFNGTTFTGTPSVLDGGTITIAVTATDSTGLTAIETFDLSVSPTIPGTPGDDPALIGTPGGDFINGFAGNDFLDGLGGNDLLVGGGGIDVIRSGGADLTWDGLDILRGGPGDDTLIVEGGAAKIHGGPGNDTIFATTTFAGDQWWDWGQAIYVSSPGGIYANLTSSPITDMIAGQSRTLQPSEIWDGHGTVDTIGLFDGTTIASGVPVIQDSPHRDIIHVDRAYEINPEFWGTWIEIRLTAGDDHVEFNSYTSPFGIARISYAVAGGGVVATLGEAGVAGTATDAINGNSFIGSDTFIGANYLRGSRYDDTLIGNSERNFFRGSDGKDFIDGGGGRDQADFIDSPAGVHVDLSKATEQVINDGFGYTESVANIEDVRGSIFDDLIVGDAGANELRGYFGNDVLIGGAGDDTLLDRFSSLGGLVGGDDILDGGIGNDTLNGGIGADIYVLSPGGGTDTIQQFWRTEGDLIDVSSFGLSSTADFVQFSIDPTTGNTVVDPAGNGSFQILNADLIADNDPDRYFIFSRAPLTVTQLVAGDFDTIFNGAFFNLDPNGDPISYGVRITGTPTATAFSLVNVVDADRVTNFTGSGFTIDANGNVTGGTITQVEFIGSATTAPQALAVVSNTSIDAVDFFSAASAAPMDMGAALDDLFDLYVIEYFGTSGADTFVGAGNIDLLAGGAGNDMLRGDGGNDILVGGPGNDTYFWSPGDGYDVVYSTGDTGGMDVIRIEGSGYFDLNWSFNNDGHFYVGVAVDSNYFWPDTGGNIRMQNFLTEGSSVQYFEADTNANGFYSADGSISRVYLTSGGIGTNQGGGFNNLSGTDQGIYTEVVTGTKLPDFLTTGGGFRDYLYGRAGDDTLVGSDSTRTDMRGGGGNDTLLGANNVDRIVGNHGFDLMDGGGGNDMARYDRDGGGNGVFVNLSAGPVTEQFQGQDTTVGPGSAIDSWGFIDTLVSIEDVRGTDTDDVIVGSSVSNNLSGRGGNDRIIGLDGDDILRGGGGADDFVFLANDTGMDTILDFGLIDDRLDLTDLLGPSFDPMNEAGYISAVADGTGNTIVSVDQTGTGEFFDPVATLNGVSSGATLTYIFNGNQTDTIDVP